MVLYLFNTGMQKLLHFFLMQSVLFRQRHVPNQQNKHKINVLDVVLAFFVLVLRKTLCLIMKLHTPLKQIIFEKAVVQK